MSKVSNTNGKGGSSSSKHVVIEVDAPLNLLSSPSITPKANGDSPKPKLRGKSSLLKRSTPQKAYSNGHTEDSSSDQWKWAQSIEEVPSDGFPIPIITSVSSLAPPTPSKPTVIDISHPQYSEENSRQSFIETVKAFQPFGADSSESFRDFDSEISRELDTLSSSLEKGVSLEPDPSIEVDLDGFPNQYLSTVHDSLIHFCDLPSCGGKISSRMCGACSNAYYCTGHHQKLDWNRHRENCIPYIVHFDPGSNTRSIYASIDIPAGKTIFEEGPLLVLPVVDPDDELCQLMDAPCFEFLRSKQSQEIEDKDGKDERWDWKTDGGSSGDHSSSPISFPEDFACSARNPTCFGCYTYSETDASNIFLCPRCGLPLCSEGCQYGFEHENYECLAIRTVLGNSGFELGSFKCSHQLFLDLEILRVLQFINIDSPGHRMFNDLVDLPRVTAYKLSEEFSLFSRNAQFLVPLSLKYTGGNTELIGNIHAIVTALSFRPTLNSTFKVIYYLKQFFKHECLSPSTYFYIDQDSRALVTKAAECIVKDNEIKVDFLATPFMSYRFRREMLKKSFIDCTCERCMSPHTYGDRSFAQKCNNCRSGLVYPENVLSWSDSIWSCSYCQEEVPFSAIERVQLKSSCLLRGIPKTEEGLAHLKKFVYSLGGHHELNTCHELIIMGWCFIERILDGKYYHLKQLINSEPHEVWIVDTVGVTRDFEILERYCEEIKVMFDAIRPGISIDYGILLFTNYHTLFVLATVDFQVGRIDRKKYIEKLMRAMKVLSESLKNLSVFESMSSRLLSLLIQDVTLALSSAKLFAAKLLHEDTSKRNLSRLTKA